MTERERAFHEASTLTLLKLYQCTPGSDAAKAVYDLLVQFDRIAHDGEDRRKEVCP